MAQLPAAVVIETGGPPVRDFSKLALRRAQFTAEVYITFPGRIELLLFIHARDHIVILSFIE